jgi:hypothetical protein
MTGKDEGGSRELERRVTRHNDMVIIMAGMVAGDPHGEYDMNELIRIAANLLDNLEKYERGEEIK